MPKARLKLLVKETLRRKNESTQNEELFRLSLQFEGLKTRIHGLVGSLTEEHRCMVAMNKSRMNVAVHMARLSENSPMSKCAGTAPMKDEEPDITDLSSYASIHFNMYKRIEMYVDRFGKFVLEYAVEWEKVVVGRVSTSLKKAKLFRRELDHYQLKVETIRLDTNKIMAKGKMVKPDQAEKLKRNEDKLYQAREHYQEFTSDLCLLIEEVTERSWKDLHPIFIKLAQFDASMGADEDKYFSNLVSVANQLKQVAYQHGLKPQARLKDLQTQHGKLISTKDGSNSTLALESGNPAQDNLRTRIPSDGGSNGTPTMSNSRSNSPSTNSPSTNSFESSHSLERDTYNRHNNIPRHNSSTSDMLVIAASAPPPPTFDQVEESTRGLSNELENPQLLSAAAPPASAPPPPPPPLSMFSDTSEEENIPVARPIIDTTSFYGATSSTPRSVDNSTEPVQQSPAHQTPRSFYNPFDSSGSVPEHRNTMANNRRPSTNPFEE